MRPNVAGNLNNADASIDEAGIAIPISQVGYISAQIITTGLSTGSLQLQVSNDPSNGLAADANGNLIPTNWSNLGSAVSMSAASVSLIGVTQVCFKWLRAVWTHTNGSDGTVTANINTQAF